MSPATATTPTAPQHNPDRADVQHFDLTIIGTGSGNSIIDERFSEQQVAIWRARGNGSAAPASTSAASRPRCSCTRPRWPRPPTRPEGRRRRATVKASDWPDIVARVFGRIDPIAHGGERCRLTNVTVILLPRVGAESPARRRICCAPKPTRRSPPTGGARGRTRGRRLQGHGRSPGAVSAPHQRHHHADRRCCPSTW